MQTYQYKKIDAFTVGKSTGNPAACIYLGGNQSLTKESMLNVAKQHKGFVSEVIYCSKNSDLSYNLTYYSSECEVDFCGHGTIACMYNLISENAELINQKEVIIHTNKKGTLHVFNEIPTQNAVYIVAPSPQYIDMNIDLKIIAENLSLEIVDVSNTMPIEIIDAGLRTLIVPIKGLGKEINVFPNEQTLKEFCLENEIDIILIYTLEVSDKRNHAHTRVFAPKFGYLEDPATGSGNSAFGYYMLKNNLWNGEPIIIEQGGVDRIFNAVNLSVKDESVVFGGNATTKIDGFYYP